MTTAAWRTNHKFYNFNACCIWVAGPIHTYNLIHIVMAYIFFAIIVVLKSNLINNAQGYIQVSIQIMQSIQVT